MVALPAPNAGAGCIGIPLRARIVAESQWPIPRGRVGTAAAIDDAVRYYPDWLGEAELVVSLDLQRL
jgi:hypothetical protein